MSKLLDSIIYAVLQGRIFDSMQDVIKPYKETISAKDDEIYELKAQLADAAILLSELVDDYRKAERFNPQLIREGQPKEIWDRAVGFYIAATGSDGNWGEYKSWDAKHDEVR